MVDPISQRDQGGNPDGEGTIVGGGSAEHATKPLGQRDDSFPGTGIYSRVSALAPCPACGGPIAAGTDMKTGQQVYKCRGQCRQTFGEGRYLDLTRGEHPLIDLHGLSDSMMAGDNRPVTSPEPIDPWMDNEPGATTFPAEWNRQSSVTERVVRSLNTEPYMPWDLDTDLMRRQADLWNTLKGVGEAVAPAAGLAALNLIPGVGEAADVAAAGDLAAGAAEGAGAADAAAGGASLLDKAKGMIPAAGAGGIAGKAIGPLMKGVMGVGGQQQAGGMAPDPVSQAPGQLQFGASSIPMLLVADLETPSSVPSVDEQGVADQHEFHDGDHNPANLTNPNLEDSGANGEDNARSDSTAYAGFAENSPGIERAQMIMPLLQHYYHSSESGERDPLVKALHETLERENPGYLNHEDDGAQEALHSLFALQQPEPRGIHAGVNMMPGGVPGPGIQQPGVQAPVQQQGTCPNCGGTINADGSCPQCGAGQTMQQTALDPNQLPGAPTLASRTAGHQGPVTPEQMAAVIELLNQQGRSGETSNVPLHPEQYAREMAEIQQNPNVAPQVDPSQQQQTPPPPMDGAQGAMPTPDPSQAGPGGQPMQPMSSDRTADANNGVQRCPNCGSSSTRIEGIGDNSGDESSAYAYCPSCGNNFDITKSSRSIYADLVDMPDPRQEPMRVWADNQGNDLVSGQTYELHSPAFPVPDIVRVIGKPSASKVELQLADGIGAQTNHPDFTVSRQEAQLENYEFVPIQMTADDRQNTDPDTVPGVSPDQVPPIQTTDQIPDDGLHTVSAGVQDDDHCRKCASADIDHSLTSPTTSLHQCYRCGHAWETQEEDVQRSAGVDLSWINDDEDPLDFTPRQTAMERATSGSRSLADVAAKDLTYQEIKARLDANEKLAGKAFSQSEKKALIDEYGVARNLEDLDLSGTHYTSAADYTGRADADKVRDEDLFLGV